MTRCKFVLAALAVAAIAAIAPAAFASGGCAPAYAGTATCHYVGAGSSAQFNSAAIGADFFAFDDIADGVTTCSYHYTAKKASNVVDLRDSRIQQEIGTLWVVWVADCSDATGNTNVTDIWTDESVDSTVGVRSFMAQESDGPGAQLQLVTPLPAHANLIAQSLWIDNKNDVDLPANVISAIGQSAAGAHINVGLTDIRPEDAYYATYRAYGTLNTSTWSGLGYKGVTTKIGAPILTAQGTGTEAVPIGFALEGNDPILKPTHAVRAYTTVSVGAAPIVFIYNNDGDGGPSNPVLNLATNIEATGTTTKYAAHLWDGTTVCDTHNLAFGGSGDGAGQPITVVLREPLSGTMNTTEFNVFRTAKNTKDSQEVGVTNPFNSPYNPLKLGCPTHGHRVRAIGTGEVVNAVEQSPAQPDARVIGYSFWGWANFSAMAGLTNYNYLTVDGVDPIGIPTTNQELPKCTTTNCGISYWPSSISFPAVRNGTYVPWSLLRWVVPATDTDMYGPTALAQSAQDTVDSTIADYVPFYSAASNDGLDVYRSHRNTTSLNATTSGCPNPASGTVWAVNGAATPTISGVGNTLGSLPDTSPVECGSDVGGLVEGPFGYDYSLSGTVTTATTGVVTWKSGDAFIAAMLGSTVTINGVHYTVSKYTNSTHITVTPDPPRQATAVPYSDTFTSAAATAPGITNKKE